MSLNFGKKDETKKFGNFWTPKIPAQKKKRKVFKKKRVCKSSAFDHDIDRRNQAYDF